MRSALGKGLRRALHILMPRDTSLDRREHDAALACGEPSEEIGDRRRNPGADKEPAVSAALRGAGELHELVPDPLTV
jgi:hypothetical protein